MKLVLIEFVDSHSCEGGWKTLGGVQKSAKTQDFCRVVGWVVADNDHSITIVNQMTRFGDKGLEREEDRCVDGDITIPKRAITHQTTIHAGAPWTAPDVKPQPACAGIHEPC